MTAEIGVGLLLNIVFWTVAVLVAVGLASLAVIEYFPGRERKGRKGSRDARSGASAGEGRVEADDAGERFRKAS